MKTESEKRRIGESENGRGRAQYELMRTGSMNLKEITALEEEWLNKRERLCSEWFQRQSQDRPHPGSSEEWGVMYEETGICDAWRRIFVEYADLAREGDIEALKRAIFLLWYELTEPLEVSWFWDLDPDRVEEVLRIVNAMAREGRLDAELQWMLPWYLHITPYYLRAKDIDDLIRVSQGDPYAYYEGCPKSSFDNRGRLGEYWRGIRDGGDQRLSPRDIAKMGEFIQSHPWLGWLKPWKWWFVLKFWIKR
jgi:hypothetical protein